MKKFFLFMVVLFIGMLIAGCSPNNSNGSHNGSSENTPTVDDQIGQNMARGNDGPIELIASEKQLPTDFDDLAFERSEKPYFKYLVKETESESEFNDGWELFKLESEKVKVNFEDTNVFFIGVIESSDCPKKIKDIETDFVQQAIVMSLEKITTTGGCNDDATKRTYVIKMDEEISERIQKMDIIERYAEDDIKTTIPIKK